MRGPDVATGVSRSIFMSCHGDACHVMFESDPESRADITIWRQLYTYNKCHTITSAHGNFAVTDVDILYSVSVSMDHNELLSFIDANYTLHCEAMEGRNKQVTSDGDKQSTIKQYMSTPVSEKPSDKKRKAESPLAKLYGSIDHSVLADNTEPFTKLIEALENKLVWNFQCNINLTLWNLFSMKIQHSDNDVLLTKDASQGWKKQLMINMRKHYRSMPGP